MEEILRSLDGSRIPSKSGRVWYSVTVAPRRNVTLEHSEREPSVLAWDRIARVYKALAGMEITTGKVDRLLGNHPADRNASTMCALVLAMQDPTRARRG